MCTSECIISPFIFAFGDYVLMSSEFVIRCILVCSSKVFAKLKATWAAVVRAASSYMKEQVSSHHFEFFGLDLIADTAGGCWLVEINRSVVIAAVLLLELSRIASIRRREY